MGAKLSVEELLGKLRLQLAGFSPDSEPANWNEPSRDRLIDLHGIEIPPPYIVFLMFVRFLGYQYGGRWEKVAWEIPVLFEGHPLILRHQKFGFQMICPANKRPDINLVKRAIHKINKAIPFVERLLDPLLRQRVEDGRITLPNQFLQLNDRYVYFRTQCLEYGSRGLSLRPSKKADSMMRGVDSFNAALVANQLSSHYAVAAIDAYFSLLEHVLVLLAAFLDELPAEPSLLQFIGANWSDKFKKIYRVADGTRAKRQYDQLNGIKERYRNVFAHGNLQKGGGSVFVHIDGVGAIPFTLTKFDSPFHFLFRHMETSEIAKAFAVFDSTLSFIEREDRTRYGFRYVRAGLAVAFDADSRAEYRAAMVSDRKFDEFIDRKIYLADQAINMDW